MTRGCKEGKGQKMVRMLIMSVSDVSDLNDGVCRVRLRNGKGMGRKGRGREDWASW